MSSMLFAGYWTGEFGWELFRWQGIIRHIASNFDTTIIGCQPTHRFLYEDFADSFFDWSIPGEARNMWFSRDYLSMIEAAKRFDAHVIYPCQEICCSDYHQNFVSYKQPVTKTGSLKFCFHARAIHGVTDIRNYPLDKWTVLRDALQKQFPLAKFCCLGTEAECVPDCMDLRNISLQAVAKTLSNNAILISPSSGLAHFATLCECPHIVWSTQQKWALGDTSRMRYEWTWNPFHAPVSVHDDYGWSPDPIILSQKISERVNTWISQKFLSY